MVLLQVVSQFLSSVTSRLSSGCAVAYVHGQWAASAPIGSLSRLAFTQIDQVAGTCRQTHALPYGSFQHAERVLLDTDGSCRGKQPLFEVLPTDICTQPTSDSDHFVDTYIPSIAVQLTEASASVLVRCLNSVALNLDANSAKAEQILCCWSLVVNTHYISASHILHGSRVSVTGRAPQHTICPQLELCRLI
jgi:hypothetical protein